MRVHSRTAAAAGAGPVLSQEPGASSGLHVGEASHRLRPPSAAFPAQWSSQDWNEGPLGTPTEALTRARAFEVLVFVPPSHTSIQSHTPLTIWPRVCLTELSRQQNHQICAANKMAVFDGVVNIFEIKPRLLPQPSSDWLLLPPVWPAQANSACARMCRALAAALAVPRRSPARMPLSSPFSAVTSADPSRLAS